MARELRSGAMSRFEEGKKKRMRLREGEVRKKFGCTRMASSIMQARARVTGRRYGLGRGGQEGGGGVS